IIPEHPWEKYSAASVWYTLVWLDGKGEHVLHVPSTKREITIDVYPSGTTYICAYPLGELMCFGTAFSPLKVPQAVVLSQEEGFLSDIFMYLDREVSSRINWEELVKVCREKAESLFYLDTQILVSSVLNGNLSSRSVVKGTLFEVGPFSVQDGIWISEREGEGRITVTDGSLPEMNLSPGVYRYYGSEMGLEMKIVCEPDGNSACLFRPALCSQ
ncbi:MAG: hypothetical protein K5634_04885, partial [Sphaerochaetaceae bacterium]|nr:hypothetical protein [Sphaerochaetaceae bacterium]